MTTSPQYEPSASGVPSIMTRVPTVHRVAHKAVQAGGDQLLIRLDGDGGPGVVVLDDDELGHGEPEEDQNIADDDDGCRHRRPSEPMVERADNQYRCDRKDSAGR